MSKKFNDNPLAERLYKLSLQSGADQEIGDSDFGTYFLFMEEGVILNEDPEGSVWIEEFSSDALILSKWSEVENRYDEWMDDYYDDYDYDEYEDYDDEEEDDESPF